MYEVIRSPSCEVFKICFFNILTRKKIVVQIKGRQKKSVIIQSFRSKKLKKILEIRQIREKTTSFSMSPSKHFSMKMGIGIYVQLFTSSSECSSCICSYAICWRDIGFCYRKLAILKHYGVTILNCQFGKNAITRLCQLIFGKYVVLYMRRNHTAPPPRKTTYQGRAPS